MPSTPFKGSLKAKRKGELTEIAQALGIDPQSHRREELEDLIRDHLIGNKDRLYSDSSFKGLLDSLDAVERRKVSARSSSVNA